ncbi:MAG: GTPase HflX [Ethanoligenens sp.]|uniref:GTPase HflX n=1 Tax=Ethanoligenens sp. TaxID=2099655 RepID=UPI0039E74FF0
MIQQQAILVGVNLQDDARFDVSMKELESLAEACDIEVVGTMSQNLEKVNSSHYIGLGKVAEVAAYVRGTGAQVVIFNDELSPSQIRNLDTAIDCEVKDRTTLILDIFARRAKTTEAKLQVEIAHLQYMLPRLVGLQSALEQQTGGVGTTNRGAGEKKLELNRRQIQVRISKLQKELETLVAQRQTQRRQRKKTGIPVVSLVGYTNAGKSTIMNALLELSDEPEEKRVLEKNQLFATLETAVRSIRLPDNKSFLLTDTVGFVDKLPHHLVKAFRSTLEEVGESDLLIHVVDCSHPDYKDQITVTNETLAQLGVADIPVIFAFNKVDLVDIPPHSDKRDSVCLSAKNRVGFDSLLELVRAHLFADYVRCEMLIPYGEGDVVSYLNQRAQIFSTEYQQGGTCLRMECRKADYEKFRRFLVHQA